jgi:hypothetical protein
LSWLVLLVAFDEPLTEDSSVVYAGPVIVHSVPASVTEGTPLTFTATVTDEDGVTSVSLNHRAVGDDAWIFAPLERGEGDVWSVTLAADELSAPGVEYYVKATDAGEVAATSNFPEESTRAPLRVDVRVQGEAFPFVEGFELEGGERSLQEMERMGFGDAPRRTRWLEAMKRMFPDVAKGDRLTGVHEPGRGARFFHNDRAIGTVDDPDFSDAFFAIWLDARTTAPSLRESLVRQAADSPGTPR